jgi:hypothetical protein
MKRPVLGFLRCLVATFRRFRTPLAVAGACVTAGQVAWWSAIGAWPFHDSVAYWLAGQHLLRGEPVYGNDPFLAFLYAPPIAVLLAPLSLIPMAWFVLGLFVAQVWALRYVAGSWTTAGLLGWLPVVPRALVTGNVDLVMSAVILAALRSRPGSGVAAAVLAFCKYSPVLAVRRWREFVAASLLLVTLTLPSWQLWLQYATALMGQQQESWWHPLTRLPLAVLLLVHGKPWARAMAAGLAVPVFHYHSLVLLLPGARLLIESQHSARPEAPSSAPPTSLVDARIGIPGE